MNGNESTPQSTAALASQVQSLQFAMVISLVCAICMGAAVFLYLSGQWHIVSRDLDNARKAIDSYNTNSVPLLRSLQQNLQTYAATHPDLMPILLKYGMAATNRPAAGPSMGGSAPGATSPRK